MVAAGVFDYPFAYRSLTLNGHRTTGGALNTGAAENDTYRVERFDPSRVQIRDQREPLHTGQGGDLGDANKTFRYIAVSGTIIATTQAKLDDAVSALLATFDIDECQLASPSTEGLFPFTFYSPTEIVGYSPVQKERFLCRPAGFPTLAERRSGGLSLPYAIELVCADPRRYLDTATTITLNSGNSFSATCPNWTALVGAHVYPVVTITMAGAGASNFAFDFATDLPGATILNLSGLSNGNIVTYDCATGKILVGATERADLRTSGVSTIQPYIVAGGAVASCVNTTNVTSVVVTYRQARG